MFNETIISSIKDTLNLFRPYIVLSCSLNKLRQFDANYNCKMLKCISLTIR